MKINATVTLTLQNESNLLVDPNEIAQEGKRSLQGLYDVPCHNEAIPLGHTIGFGVVKEELTEWIKNVMDAQGTQLVITFLESDTGQQVIYVQDNGKGFSSDFLEGKETLQYRDKLRGHAHIRSDKKREQSLGGSGRGLAQLDRTLSKSEFQGTLLLRNHHTGPEQTGAEIVISVPFPPVGWNAAEAFSDALNIEIMDYAFGAGSSEPASPLMDSPPSLFLKRKQKKSLISILSSPSVLTEAFTSESSGSSNPDHETRIPLLMQEEVCEEEVPSFPTSPVVVPDIENPLVLANHDEIRSQSRIRRNTKKQLPLSIFAPTLLDSDPAEMSKKGICGLFQKKKQVPPAKGLKTLGEPLSGLYIQGQGKSRF